MDELKLLEKFKKLRQGKSVVIGPGDDAAVIKNKGQYLLFCGDMLIESVHFITKKVTFPDIGYKAVARTLSDIASMAGIPKYVGISLALPRKYSHRALGILAGAKRIAKEYKISIVGGDISRADKIFLDVWCIGYVDKKNLARRKGAKCNDGIFVSGKLGKTPTRESFVFKPKIKEARYLVRNFKIHSMIDISDGLVLDLYKMLKESKKRGVLFEDKIPLKQNTKLLSALYGGEEYQLLFTTSLKNKTSLCKQGFYHIGVIEKGPEPEIYLKNLSGKKRKLKVRGYLSI